MGEAAKVAGYGWPSPGDGGTRDTRTFGRCGGAPRPAPKHTATRRRVRPGRASTVTSPLSASRADEKQFSTSTEQVRERRARMGRCGRAARAPGGEWGWRWRGRRQERRAAAESHALVGAHGRAPSAALPARERAAALRDGAAPRRALPAARRVTPRAAAPLYHITLTFHYRDDQTRRSPECARVPEYYRLANLFIWDAPGAM